ncbi:MAG: hypothetical protein JW874_06070 [Spirochaetales bacterium]|nr:hypothetical protein [Spirochaetales bacterium]
MKKILLIFCVLSLLSCGKGQRPEHGDKGFQRVEKGPGVSFFSATGSWTGTLEISGRKSSLVFHIGKSASGISTVIDSPDQHKLGISASETEIKGRTVKISIAELNAVFSGTVNENNQIDGVWKQNGLEVPLLLERTGKPGPASGIGN